MAYYIVRNKKKYFRTKHQNIFKCEDGFYAYRLYVPTADVDTFVTRDKITKKKFESEREALSHQLDQMDKAEKKAVVDLSDTTIGAIWDKMSETEGKSAGTIRKHTSVYTHHIEPLFANIKIKDLTVGSIRELLQTLYTVGDGTGGREGGYSYGFVESILKWFYWLYNYSFENNYMGREQFKDFIDAKNKMPNKVKASDNKKLRVLKNAEISAIFNLLKGTDLYLPALISLCTGARTGECFALCWSDVDFENRMININKRIVEEEGGLLVIKVPKTQLTKRDVPIPDMLYTALYHRRQEQLAAKEEKPEIWAKNRITIIDDRDLNRKPILMPDFINVDNNGKYIKASSFNPYAKKIRETICPNEIGVEEFSFYTFRKTHISEMATKLTELVLIQHTGHSRVDTIRKYYAARTDEMDKRIGDAVRQVSDQFKWSMAVNSALPVGTDSSKYKPSKEHPLYTKPVIEIPYTHIPMELVPLDNIKNVYNEANRDDFLLNHLMVLDCATLSPIGCYGSWYDAEKHATEDDIIININEEEKDMPLEQAILEAFADEHIILE